jgi:hypothetical protein
LGAISVMEFIQKIKTPAIILGIFVVAFLLYRNFIMPEDLEPITEVSITPQGAVLVLQTEEFRASLDKLNLIKLDDSIFNAPQFQLLIDNTSRALERIEAVRGTTPTGKPNPFLPLSIQQSSQSQGTGTSRSPLPGR